MPAPEAQAVLSVRRQAARGLDALAVLIVLAAIVRFAVLPRLHAAAPHPAPPVSLATLGGGRLDLHGAPGRLVILEFGATWCEPCRESIPLVQHFRRTHPGVEVDSIDVGEDAALVRPFAAKLGMGDVALDPDERTAHAYGVQGFPTVVAIDAHGDLRARWVGFDPEIERALSETAARYAPGRVSAR